MNTRKNRSSHTKQIRTITSTSSETNSTTSSNLFHRTEIEEKDLSIELLVNLFGTVDSDESINHSSFKCIKEAIDTKIHLLTSLIVFHKMKLSLSVDFSLSVGSLANIIDSLLVQQKKEDKHLTKINRQLQEAQGKKPKNTDEIKKIQAKKIVIMKKDHLSPLILNDLREFITYTLEPMTSLPDNDINQAVDRKVYLSKEGKYVCRDLKGIVRKGIEVTLLKKGNLADNLQNEEFVKSTLGKILNKVMLNLDFNMQLAEDELKSLKKYDNFVEFYVNCCEYAEPLIPYLRKQRTSKAIVTDHLNRILPLVGYGLELMSSLPGKDKNKAETGKIYLSADGKYIVRDPRGIVQEGRFDIKLLKGGSLTDNLKNKQFADSILEITSNAGHTPLVNAQAKTPLADLSIHDIQCLILEARNRIEMMTLDQQKIDSLVDTIRIEKNLMVPIEIKEPDERVKILQDIIKSQRKSLESVKPKLQALVNAENKKQKKLMGEYIQKIDILKNKIKTFNMPDEDADTQQELNRIKEEVTTLEAQNSALERIIFRNEGALKLIVEWEEINGCKVFSMSDENGTHRSSDKNHLYLYQEKKIVFYYINNTEYPLRDDKNPPFKFPKGTVFNSSEYDNPEVTKDILSITASKGHTYDQEYINKLENAEREYCRNKDKIEEFAEKFGHEKLQDILRYCIDQKKCDKDNKVELSKVYSVQKELENFFSSNFKKPNQLKFSPINSLTDEKLAAKSSSSTMQDCSSNSKQLSVNSLDQLNCPFPLPSNKQSIKRNSLSLPTSLPMSGPNNVGSYKQIFKVNQPLPYQSSEKSSVNDAAKQCENVQSQSSSNTAALTLSSSRGTLFSTSDPSLNSSKNYFRKEESQQALDDGQTRIKPSDKLNH